MVDMIFKPAARYPADPRVIFILALSVFSGITAFALEAGPETLNALLPRWGVVLWGVLLTLGSLATLIGMTMQNRDGVLLEQGGSATIAATTLFYSALGVWVAGPAAIQVIGVIFAWGLACGFRWVQLQVLLVQSYHRQQAEEKLADDAEDSA